MDEIPRQTAIEFLANQQLIAVEYVNDYYLYNLVTEEQYRGLDIDTSNIPGGTLLTRTDQFTLDGNILTLGDKTYDLSTIYMLG